MHPSTCMCVIVLTSGIDDSTGQALKPLHLFMQVGSGILNLQVSESRAAEIDNTLQVTIQGTHLSSVASLQLHVRLLHAIRPAHFPSFKGFQRWQQSTAAALSAIVIWSASHYGQVRPHARSLWSFDGTGVLDKIAARDWLHRTD